MIDAEAFMKTSKEFEAGVPVVAIEADYLRTIWVKSRELEKNRTNADRVHIAIGAGLLGLDDGVHTAEQAHAAWIRGMLLGALMDRGVLAAHVNGGDPAPEVFAAAATMPCAKEDLAEAVIQRMMAEASPEAAEESKREMRAGGYDPDHPMIDGKFLGWMERGK